MSLELLKRRQFLARLGLSALLFNLTSQNSLVRANTAGRSPSVLVLGAGLSGLYAALLLERAGVTVTVLEGRGRVGGRVHTLDDLPGKPEAGSQVLSEKYSRLLKLAARYKIPLELQPKPSKEVLLYVNGQSVLPKQWASSQANRLVKSEKQILPPALMTHYLRPHNPLKTSTDWIAQKYRNLDIPLKDFLLTQGASEEALRLMDIFPPSMNSITTASALWGLKNDQLAQARGSKPLQVAGGNSRLPEKLAAALSSPVQLHKVVEEVKSGATGVTVCCADGSSFNADYALLTLPFSVMRRLKINPPLEGNQKEAVEELPYAKITQVYFSVQGSLWKDDGYPLKMWTDSLLEQIFPVKDETGRVQGFVAWANGDNADKLARSKQEVKQTVKAQLQQIRPTMAENIDISRVITWGSDPFSLGAYSHFAPGQIRQWADEMARPWHRIHFAGEHTAVTSAGMEGALESAERAVQELLLRVRSR